MKRVISIILTAVIMIGSIQLQPAKAGASGHVHTDSCYTGHRHGYYVDEYGRGYTCSGRHEHTYRCLEINMSNRCGGVVRYNGTMNTSGWFSMSCSNQSAHYGGSLGYSETWWMGLSDTDSVSNVSSAWFVDDRGNTTEVMVPFAYVYPEFGSGKHADAFSGKYPHRVQGSHLVCGKSSNKIYEDNCLLVQDDAPVCGDVVMSITAVPPSLQYQGDPLNKSQMLVTATFLDGHTAPITAYSDNLDSSSSGNKTVIITYSGLVDNAKKTGIKTTTITINVVPKTTSCNYGRGHGDYLLNADTSDPGCPICKAIDIQKFRAENNTVKLKTAVSMLEKKTELFHEYLNYLKESRNKVAEQDQPVLDMLLLEVEQGKSMVSEQIKEGEGFVTIAENRICQIASIEITTEHQASELADLIHKDTDKINTYLADLDAKILTFTVQKEEVEELIKKAETAKEIDKSVDKLVQDFDMVQNQYHLKVNQYNFDEILKKLKEEKKIAIESEKQEIDECILKTDGFQNDNIGLDKNIVQLFEEVKQNIQNVNIKIQNKEECSYSQIEALKSEIDFIKSENERIVISIDTMLAQMDLNYNKAIEMKNWTEDKNYAKQRKDIKELASGLEEYKKEIDSKCEEIERIQKKAQASFQQFCEHVEKVKETIKDGILDKDSQMVDEKRKELNNKKAIMDKELESINNSIESANGSKIKIETYIEEVYQKIDFAQDTPSKSESSEAIRSVTKLRENIEDELKAVREYVVAVSGSGVTIDLKAEESENIKFQIEESHKNYMEEKKRQETITDIKDILNKLHELANQIEDKKDGFKGEILSAKKEMEQAKTAWEKNENNASLKAAYETLKEKTDRLEEMYHQLTISYDKIQEILKQAEELVSKENAYNTYTKAKKVLEQLIKMLDEMKELVQIIKESYANIDVILHPPAISEPSNPNGTGNSSGGNPSGAGTGNSSGGNSGGAGTGNSGGENFGNMENGNSVLLATSNQSKSIIKNKIISYPVQTREGKVIRTSNYISDTVLMAKDEYLISKELGVKGDYRSSISFGKQSKYENYTWYAYKIKTGEIMKCSIENLTIDYVKPKISIKSSNKAIVLNPKVKNTYKILTNKTVTIKIKADYGISGKNKLQYQFVEYGKAVQKNKNWSAVKKDTIKIKNNRKGRIYIKAVDKAGNEKIVKTAGFHITTVKVKK